MRLVLEGGSAALRCAFMSAGPGVRTLRGVRADDGQQNLRLEPRS
eukprot:COSAG04_NODE_30463_length_262_cov_1.018405_1_plen_44_part_01